MNKIDLIILGIIAVFVLIGYYRGLIGTLLSLVQYVVVIFLSLKFAPFVAKLLIDVFKIDTVIFDWIKNNPDAISGVVSMMSNEVLQSIIGRIINVMALIILFIVLKLIFAIIVRLLNKISKLPILNEINKLGGILIGVVEGVVFVYLAMIIINWLPIFALNGIKELLPTSLIGSMINGYLPAVASDIVNMVKVIAT